MKLVALQFKTNKNNYQENLDELKSLINECEENSIILAPEVCISEFAYENMQKASEFSNIVLKEIKELSINKTIGLTLITKENESFLNTFFLISNGKIIHTQSKSKLFPLGNEQEYFIAGNENDIKIIEINGIKIATLICFELRFPQLWEKIKGADIILNPAMWGIKRKEHYETITRSLALVNQAYLIASNSSNDNMASSSAVIDPFGLVNKDDNKKIITMDFEEQTIKKVRKYINIGLDTNE